MSLLSRCWMESVCVSRGSVGTFVAGVSLAFCSRPQRENIDCSSLVLVNVWIAVFQLISSFLFLIGWIWSVIWGVSFISISSEFYVHNIFDVFTICIHMN